MLTLLPDSDIERFIDEDLPYGDLTTHLLGIADKTGIITFTTRDETTLCCTEEAGRVLEKCGCTITMSTPSGTLVPAREQVLRATGTARAVHAGWKVALNLLEYGSGIATRTARIVTRARQVNPHIAVLTTRKAFPGTKKIAIKAIMAGGALPHRLGLSETVLVFKQHTAFLGGLEPLLALIGDMGLKARETKIIIEAESIEEALLIARSSAHVVQLDKIAPPLLSEAVSAIRSINPDIIISAAGGINEANAAQYAASGIDIIVLSSVYFGKPADMGATIIPA